MDSIKYIRYETSFNQVVGSEQGSWRYFADVGYKKLQITK